MQLRPTPRHIDRSSRVIELLLVALVPFVLVRPFHELAGLALMLVLPMVYARLTLDRAEGHLLHLMYALGVPVRGLLPRRLHRLDR
jgi:hypothetical protein